MKLQRLQEFEIDEATESAIAGLLGSCFPEYPEGRIYYKQLPDFRFLCWENEALIAHMAVEHRIVNNDGQAFRGNGKLTPEQEEIRRLKSEVKQLRLEKQILKEAAVFFAKETK